MASSAAALDIRPSNHGMEDFAALLDEQLGRDTGFEGSVVTGRVVRLTDEYAIVDVGLKSEGRVALKEFAAPGQKPEVKPGDNIELYVERYEDRDGSIVLSREKARREEAWTNLERAFEAQQRVIDVRLPYLVEIDRERLEANLGEGVRVTRTAVQVSVESDEWQSRLLEILARLAEGERVAAGL